MPPILIIGAGIGGLTLAQCLMRHSIPFQIYDRDPSLTSRPQGYRLKIPPSTTGRLRQAITPRSWETLVRTSAASEAGETNLNAVDGSVSACRRERLPPGVEPPLAVDRGLLRWALAEGIIRHLVFGKRLVSWQVMGNDSVKANFQDGSFALGSLLVGADGARSVIRNGLLPGSDPSDTSVCCIYGKTTLDATLEARFPERHRRWLTVVHDQTPVIQTIIAGRTDPVTMVCEPCRFSNRDEYEHIPPDYLHFGILFPRSLLGPHLSDHDVDAMLKDQAPDLALDITSEWHPSIRSLIELQNRQLTSGMRVFSAPVQIPVWDGGGLVTMIGDAVHLMSPAGGVGATATLEDAILLGDIISDKGVSSESISSFEQRMRESASAYIRRSLLAGNKFLDLPL
ncbi:cercosporin toxin biosynthesis protein [Ophiocordyceps camponoti-floridani]|uniref:Cercosporin toxin biosynthesis protein n=1 Tax=Ophiocordyceps camponoti-floridani TaxID=2030778 RepID=A0A8H4QB22_9HYPO|nr:cercosporin toxin biosynthesis protein [Ophiocordyceps camponoti-floridani]